MENIGPEISNFIHTIPNYYRHFVQIIARKSMTGRGGRLRQCLFQRYNKFSLLLNTQIFVAHNLKLLCLPFYRDLRLQQEFGTERKSRVNETLKVITNINEIQFRDRIKGFETLDFWRYPIHTACYFVGNNSWICVSRKISSVSPEMCGRSLLYLVDLPFERIFAKNHKRFRHATKIK